MLSVWSSQKFCHLVELTLNPLPHMPIEGFSNSAANKGMMAKIWKNGDTSICLSRKHCGERRNR